MTFNTKDLRDGHLPLVERIDIALRRVTNGEGQMRVPVEATDPDIVLHNCRDRIVELEAKIKELEDNEDFKIDLMNGLREDLSQAQRLLGVDRQKNATLETQLAEARTQHQHCDLLLNSANADLRECQSALRLALAGTEQHYFAGPARIDDVRAALAEAQAQIAAKDKRIAELEQLAALSPIKVGDISITLGLTETGEARMTFDGADDATLAVVAGKFALAMQATMESAKEVPNA